MTALIDAIGPSAAVTAAEIAGTLSMTNRIMDAIGAAVPAHALEIALPILEQIGAMDFPHAGLVRTPQGSIERKLRRFVGRLRR